MNLIRAEPAQKKRKNMLINTAEPQTESNVCGSFFIENFEFKRGKNNELFKTKNLNWC